MEATEWQNSLVHTKTVLSVLFFPAAINVPACRPEGARIETVPYNMIFEHGTKCIGEYLVHAQAG